MITETKTGFSILISIRNIINRWRNIPLIEEQRQTIAALESQVTALQQANALIHGTTLEQQETITAQQSRIRELEDMNTQLNDWKIEAENYELHQEPPGVFMYRYKNTAQPIKPLHYLCADCYNRSIKSILHVTDEELGQTHFTCHTCNTVFKVGEKPRTGPINRKHPHIV